MEVSNFKMKGSNIAVKDATARSSIASINTSIGTINKNIGTINKNIGNINTLPTTDKSSIVNSIKELDTIIKSMQNANFPIGHFIFSKTCDTEAKVIANYGGVHWRRITDKFIGACGNVLSINGGGSNSAQLSLSNIPSHSHSLSGTFTTSETTASHTHEFFTDEQGAHTHYVSTNSNDSVIRAGGTGFGGTGGNVTVQNASVLPTSSSGMHQHHGTTNPGGEAHTHDVTLSGSTGSTGSGQAFSIIPSYEGAYVWVREE